MKLILLSFLMISCTAAQCGTCDTFTLNHDIKWVNTPVLPFEQIPALNSTPGANPYDYWIDGANIDTDFPDKFSTQSLIRNHNGTVRHVYLNIENLPNVYQASTILEQFQTAQKLTSIAHWVKSGSPDIEIGFYSNVVQTGYPFTANNPSNKKTWEERNAVFLPLAEFVDVIYLNMYTIWEDPNKWTQQLDDTLIEARKTGKPVKIFIWPRYHQGSPTAANEMIPGKFWRLQLEQAYLKTDGALIWTGGFWDWNDLSSETDPNNWWYQTLDFMQKKGL